MSSIKIVDTTYEEKPRLFECENGELVKTNHIPAGLIIDDNLATQIKDLMMESAINHLQGRNRIEKKSLSLLYDEQENGEVDWEIVHVIRPKNTA